MTPNVVMMAIAIITLLVLGATARWSHNVLLRTLLVYLVALAITVWATGAMERGVGSRWLTSAESWGENLGRYLGMLVWSSVAWGIARWVRRGREIREQRRRQQEVHDRARGAPPKASISLSKGRIIDKYTLRRPRLNAPGRAESNTMSREHADDRQIDCHETVTVHRRGKTFGGGEVWRGPLFQAIRTVMAMPPDQQHLASIYFYDDDATIITFTDIKEIAERADFQSQG